VVGSISIKTLGLNENIDNILIVHKMNLQPNLGVNTGLLEANYGTRYQESLFKKYQKGVQDRLPLVRKSM
jgi:hypothetical protein